MTTFVPTCNHKQKIFKKKIATCTTSLYNFGRNPANTLLKTHSSHTSVWWNPLLLTCKTHNWDMFVALAQCSCRILVQRYEHVCATPTKSITKKVNGKAVWNNNGSSLEKEMGWTLPFSYGIAMPALNPSSATKKQYRGNKVQMHVCSHVVYSSSYCEHIAICCMHASIIYL